MSFQGKRPEKPKGFGAVVIDGYNLAHLMGWLPILDGSTLAKAREKLLSHLASISLHPHRITVVFDARGARAAGVPRHLLDSPRHRHKSGIEVIFAMDQEADDVIEDLMETHRKTGGGQLLVVVSNDRRLHAGAKRNHCLALTSDQFLDRMEAILHKESPPAGEAEKPDAVTDEEKQQAMADFGELEKSREGKKALDPYGFGDFLGP